MDHETVSVNHLLQSYQRNEYMATLLIYAAGLATGLALALLAGSGSSCGVEEHRNIYRWTILDSGEFVSFEEEEL